MNQENSCRTIPFSFNFILMKFSKFQEIVDKGFDLNYSEGNKKSAYEYLLSNDLKKRLPFLKLCLERGCDVNYVNPKFKKSATYYAAESLNFCNLFLLLYHNENVAINVDYPFNGSTPLNFLAKSLTASNVGVVGESMEILLRKGASVDIPDGKGLVPLNYVLENKRLPENDKYELVYMLLLRYKKKDPIVNEAWSYVENNHNERHLQLERKSLDEIIRNRSRLDKSSFLKRRLSESYTKKYSEKVNYQIGLMERFIKRSDNNALKILLQTIYINSDNENMIIILKAICFGNIQLIEKILKPDKLKLPNLTCIQLLKEAINDMPETSDNKYCNYVKCFKKLLKSKLVDVSAPDNDRIPPLTIAAKLCNERAINELLSNGAYMGMRSDYGELPITRIRPEILEEHLDRCVTMDNVKSKDNNININLSNISHPPKKKSTEVVHNDMQSIAHIRKSKELHHLLQHPVITSLLLHKWHLFNKFFYLHFVVYLVFQIFITIHILLRFPYRHFETIPVIISCSCWLLIGYLLVRELIQISLGWIHYLCSLRINITDTSIIVISTLTCFEFGSEETQSIIATCAVLLTFFKLLLLASSLRSPWISMPLLMLLEVSRTVIRYIIVFFFLVLTFSLCFYIRFSKPLSMENSNSTDNLSLSFDNFITSFFKSFIMATGEYDAGNIIFKSCFDFLWLIIFAIIVGIAFFNLLTGQAVSDIQMIKDQAEIYKAISQINFLSTCELFLNHPWWNRWIFIRFKYLMDPTDKPVRKITIPKYQYPHKMTLEYYPTIESQSTEVSHANKDCQSPHTEITPSLNQEIIRKARQFQVPEDNPTAMATCEDTPSPGTISVDIEEERNAPLLSRPQEQVQNDKSNIYAYMAKMKEQVVNLFSIESYHVDAEMFKRALSIAEKGSMKEQQPDLERRLKLLEDQNRTICQGIQMLQNYVIEANKPKQVANIVKNL